MKKKTKKTSTFLNELSTNKTYIDNQHRDIIKKLLNTCKDFIKNANNNNLKNYIYEVPQFIFGYPIYDIILVSAGVNVELKKLGLKTLYVKPNKIYICWKN